MSKQTIKDINLTNKKVLHHCDFNIKLKANDKGELVPVSDVRIKAFFPSIFYLLEQKAKIIFMSYLERPGGKVVENLRLAPVAKRLSQLINKEVVALPDCIGPKVKEYIDQMQPGQMVMLENTRFYPGEEADDPKFAKSLASLGDLMVEDAFGHCHRKHASTTGIPKFIPTVAGFYLMEEINVFDNLMTNPVRPLILIIGGTKTSDKIGAIKKLAPLTDKILIGGAVANIFWQARGKDIGKSFLEEPFVDKAKDKKINPVDLAKELLTEFKDKIVLPEDLVSSKKELNYLDLGDKTIKNFENIIKNAQTIFWDGPMGKYEEEEYSKGTFAIANAIAQNKGITVLAGGDTAASAEKYDLLFKYKHVSIAGGAALEYLAGEKLPGIEAIENK